VFLIDTSIWIAVLRDTSGQEASRLKSLIQEQPLALSRFTQLELLQGARDEREWRLLEDALRNHNFLEATLDTWPAAARIYFELRRQGKTVRSAIDCCIAQIAIQHRVCLIHRDRDFGMIARFTSLQERYLPAS